MTKEKDWIVWLKIDMNEKRVNDSITSELVNGSELLSASTPVNLGTGQENDYYITYNNSVYDFEIPTFLILMNLSLNISTEF